MRKHYGLIWFIVLSVMFIAWSSPVQAAYTVTGDIGQAWDKNTNTYSTYGTTGGSLWFDVFKETSSSSAGGADGTYSKGVINRVNNNTYNSINHNWIEGDYVLVTGASGKALYSIGEIDPRFGNSTVTLTDSNSDGIYDLSGAGRSVTGVTDIEVVHAADVWVGYGTLTKSTGVTVSGAASASYTLVELQAMPSVTYTATYSNKTTSRTGPTIASVLEAAGVDTGNLLSYAVAISSDGYKTILSMYELKNVNENEDTNYALANGQSPHTSGVLDMLSVNGEGSGVRSVITADVNNGRWGKGLTEINVSAVPLPPSLLLLAPGLLGLIGLRKRMQS